MTARQSKRNRAKSIARRERLMAWVGRRDSHKLPAKAIKRAYKKYKRQRSLTVQNIVNET